MAGEMNQLSAATSGISAKGFFSRPEGKVGMIFPILAAGAIFYFFGSPIGDFLVNAVDNMLHLVIVGSITVAALFVIADPKVRALGFYIYRSFMRMLTGFFIDIDPIGILRTYKERMEGKLGDMKTALDSLKGQKKRTEIRQRENNKALENVMALLNQANLKQDQSQINIHGKQAARLETKAERYAGELSRLTLLTTIMDRYYRLCEDTIVDMSNEINYREEERQEAKESRKAVGAAMAILKGLPEKDMWDDATLKLQNDYAAALGEVDNFLDMTKNILSTADLQDGADTEKALAMLDAWQAKNSNVTLGGKGGVTKSSIITDAVAQMQLPSASGTTINLSVGKPQYVPVAVKTSTADSGYGDVFDKK